MILISHRGNINGKSNRENQPEYIQEALVRDFDVEVDIWYTDGEFWLGHDEPQYQIKESFLENSRLWCHSKNIEGLNKMLKNNLIHCFWHQNDTLTLTSKNIVWTVPKYNFNEEIIPNSVAVLPEYGYNGNIRRCYGICSDVIIDYRRFK